MKGDIMGFDAEVRVNVGKLGEYKVIDRIKVRNRSHLNSIQRFINSGESKYPKAAWVTFV